MEGLRSAAPIAAGVDRHTVPASTTGKKCITTIVLVDTSGVDDATTGPELQPIDSELAPGAIATASVRLRMNSPKARSTPTS